MTTTDYKSIANKLKFEGRAYINGKYVDASDGAKFENINPATGETLCSVAKCNHKDVDVAVIVARKAFHLAKSLPCGTVSINTFSEGDIKVPFGGYKQSGSLSRDQGTEALNQYLQTKTIWISHS